VDEGVLGEKVTCSRANPRSEDLGLPLLFVDADVVALPASQPGRVPGLVVRQAGSNNNVGDEAVPDEDLRAVEVEQALAEDATIPISEGAAGAIPAESAIGDAFPANRGVPDEGDLTDDVLESLAVGNVLHLGLAKDDFGSLGVDDADEESLVEVEGLPAGAPKHDRVPGLAKRTGPEGVDEKVLHFGLAEDDVDDLVNTGAAVSFGNGHFEGLANENNAPDGLEQDDFATLGLAGADEALVDEALVDVVGA
jgi:hypothetical protein